LTVLVCAVVVEITTKRTFIQLVFLKAGLGTLQPIKAVFQNISFRPKSSASVVTYLIYPLRNKFPVVWEFLGIPSYSKTCKLCFIQDLGISGNIWE